jgi:hypothetical protein
MGLLREPRALAIIRRGRIDFEGSRIALQTPGALRMYIHPISALHMFSSLPQSVTQARRDERRHGSDDRIFFERHISWSSIGLRRRAAHAIVSQSIFVLPICDSSHYFLNLIVASERKRRSCYVCLFVQDAQRSRTFTLTANVLRKEKQRRNIHYCLAMWFSNKTLQVVVYKEEERRRDSQVIYTRSRKYPSEHSLCLFAWEICASKQRKRSCTAALPVSWMRMARAEHSQQREGFWQERRRESHSSALCAFNARKMKVVDRS